MLLSWLYLHKFLLIAAPSSAAVENGKIALKIHTAGQHPQKAFKTSDTHCTGNLQKHNGWCFRSCGFHQVVTSSVHLDLQCR